MNAEIAIEEAVSSDLPVIIEICCRAVETEVLTRFLYSHSPTEAFRKQTESLTKSLGKRFTEPTNRCYIHKAVEKDSGTIVGWILVKWEDGRPYAPPAQDGPNQQTFPAVYQREVRSKWDKITAGKPHVAIGALYVMPNRQRSGIGRHLVDYIYSKYDLDKELVIAQTRAVSEGFYQRLGWVTVDSADFDLSKWGGQGMGYGLHRSPQMVKYPQNKQ